MNLADKDSRINEVWNKGVAGGISSLIPEVECIISYLGFAKADSPCYYRCGISLSVYTAYAGNLVQIHQPYSTLAYRDMVEGMVLGATSEMP